jgi:hypothetical protein
MTTLDFEMSFNHMLGGNVYNPELFEMEVTGYRAAIRTITDFAVNNSETPTTEENFSTRTETGGESVAYVTTGEVGTEADALRRTHEQLSFDPDTETYRTTEEAELTGGLTEFGFDVEEGLHSMGVHLHGQNALADLELVSPDGEVVRSFEGVTDERVGGKCCGLPEFTVSEPKAGTWTLRASNYLDAGVPVEMQQWAMAADANPDPESVDNWGGEGYEQAAYDVTPFEFFRDYESAEKRGVLREFIQDGGTLEPVTVDEVKSGALSEYDHAVVIHDYVSPTERISEGVSENAKDGVTGGVTDDAYTSALDEFVDSGGNLVVTDTGSYVLPELDNDLFDGSALEGNVQRQFLDVARFTAKNLDHPLFSGDVRGIQNQLWKVQPLGYPTTGGAPMDLLDEAAFTEAAAGVGSIAGRTNGLVATASVTESESSGRGIHYISSLLPPATQANLHPFGLQNYTPTFLGYILFTSALGFQQVRETGETTRTYGRGDEWEVGGIGGGGGADLSVTGSRTTDSQFQFGSRIERVELTVESVDTEADGVEIRDRFPDSWEFNETFSDGTSPDGESYVTFEDETTDPAELEGTTFTYFVETPSGLESSGSYTVGPGVAIALDTEGDVSDEFAGTKTIYVLGADAV